MFRKVGEEDYLETFRITSSYQYWSVSHATYSGEGVANAGRWIFDRGDAIDVSEPILNRVEIFFNRQSGVGICEQCIAAWDSRYFKRQDPVLAT